MYKHLITVFVLFSVIIAHAQKRKPLHVDMPDTKTGKMTPSINSFSHDNKKIYYNNVSMQDSDPDKEVKVLKVMYERYALPQDAMMSAIPPPRYYTFLYFSNNGHIYCNGVKLKGADAGDFTVLFHLYVRSNQHIYFKDKELKGIDANAFTKMQELSVFDDRVSYTRDNKNVFYKGEIMDDVDIPSFKIMEHSYFSKDTNKVYYEAQTLKGISGSNFQSTGYKFLKNKQHAYMLCTVDSLYGNIRMLPDGGVEDGSGQLFYFFSDSIKNEALNKRTNNAQVSRIDMRGLWWHTEYNALKCMDADAATFRIIKLIENTDLTYGVDTNKVFLNSNIISGANPASFHLVGGANSMQWYGADDKHVFFTTQKVEGADPESFRMMWSIGKYYGYSKDKNSVYLNGKVLDSLTVANFDIAGYYFKKGDKVWLRVPYSDALAFQIAEADAASFTTYDEGYAKKPCSYASDRNYAYYRGQPIIVADVSTFQVFSHSGYACDKKHLYFNGKVINTAPSFDKNSFTVIAYLDLYNTRDDNTIDVYAKDNRHVYFNGQILESCDPKNFSIHTTRGFIFPTIYAYANGKVYCRGKLIAGADSSTLKIATWDRYTSPYSSDEKHIYWENKIVGNAGQDIRVYPSGYAQIGNKIFYGNIEIPDADCKSFRSDESGTYATDNNAVYFKDKKLTDVDVNGFDVLALGYARNKKKVFYNGLPVQDAGNSSIRTEYGVGDAFFNYDDKYIYYQGKRWKIANKNKDGIIPALFENETM